VRHTMGLSPPKLARLQHDTWSFVSRGVTTGLDLSRLVGRWVWASLPFRPALSVLSSSFRLARSTRGRLFSLWPSVRLELTTLANLGPLLVCDFAASFFERLIATDASETGLGVTAASASLAERHTVAACAALPPPVAPAESPGLAWVAPALAQATVSKVVRWSTIVAARWHRPEHINSLELRALSTAVRWALSFPTSLRSRLVILSDSSVVVGAVSKGRSSSPVLLRRLRHVAAHCLAAGLRLYVAWLPTHLNPADHASRI
jgi:hypothetical protein